MARLTTISRDVNKSVLAIGPIWNRGMMMQVKGAKTLAANLAHDRLTR